MGLYPQENDIIVTSTTDTKPMTVVYTAHCRIFLDYIDQQRLVNKKAHILYLTHAKQVEKGSYMTLRWQLTPINSSCLHQSLLLPITQVEQGSKHGHA